MRTMMVMGISATTAMIALALGYIVITLANKEKGGLKKIGNIIGVSIIVISALLILAKALGVAKVSTGYCKTLRHYKMMLQEKTLMGERPTIPKK